MIRAESNAYGAAPAHAIEVIAPLPVCRPDQIDAHIYDMRNGAGGHMADGIDIYNRASFACALRGRGDAELRDASGVVVAHRSDLRPFMDGGAGDPVLVVVDPQTDSAAGREKGSFAVLTIAQGACPGGRFPKNGSLWLKLPDGDVIIHDFHDTLNYDYRCDLQPQDYPPVTDPPELLVGSFYPSS